MRKNLLKPFQARLLLQLGVLYLLIIASGVFAHFLVRMQLMERIGDPDFLQVFFAQAERVRASLLADALMVGSDVLVGWLFYRLLKEVNPALSLLAAIFRWIQSAILGYGLFRLLALRDALDWEGRAMVGTQSSELIGQIEGLLSDHAQLYIVSGVFFGLSCILLGVLFVRAAFMPGYLGVMLSLAGITYVLDGIVNFFAPAYAGFSESLVTVAALFAEIFLCLWLLIAGIGGLIRFRGSRISD